MYSHLLRHNNGNCQTTDILNNSFMKKASCGKIIIAGDFFPVDENESFFCKGDI